MARSKKESGRNGNLESTQSSNGNASTTSHPDMVNLGQSHSTMNGKEPAEARDITSATIQTILPAWIQTGVMVGLIFGGCCSNVFALEAIVKSEPDAGLLITLTQFLLVAVTHYPHFFSASHPPFFLKPHQIPLHRWAVNIILFFAVNVLNNHAFGYNISVPVHIILRSGGSVTTIAVGYLWGKRFSRMQVGAVALLTVGVVIAAMSDARAQGKTTTTNSSPDTSTFLAGLFILFLAQLLSAIMGLYIQATYTRYGSHWRENLFYSHLLSLPLFLPFLPSIRAQLAILARSPPIPLPSIPIPLSLLPTWLPQHHLPAFLTLTTKSPHSPALLLSAHLPSQLVNLALNAIAQYACIRGVNLLAARSSALTVTIVLNIRKLASLLLSIWLFGNRLDPGVLLGAVVVFAAGGLYAWEGQRKKAAVVGVAEEKKGGGEEKKEL